MIKRILLFCVVLGLSACATTQGSGPRRSSTVLMAEEIGELAVTTAYEAVQMARPRWLNVRANPAQGSPAAPVVYSDGIRVGNLDELRRIRATVVIRMEFLSPSDATNRFGTNHTGGAILVTTR
jgi:hypothetical protein